MNAVRAIKQARKLADVFMTEAEKLLEEESISDFTDEHPEMIVELAKIIADGFYWAMDTKCELDLDAIYFKKKRKGS
jgi:hypothetical protein